MERFAGIGLGRCGSRLSKNLAAQGAEVIAIDVDEGPVARLRDRVSVAVRMDGTDERAMREQGVGNVDVAVVGIASSLEAAQLSTVILKRLGVGRVVAKSPSPMQLEILSRIGADEVVTPEKESALRLAHRLIAPQILDYLELSEGHSLVQLEAPAKFHGKSIRELDVRNVYGVNIVAVKKRREVGREESGEPVYEERVVDIPRPTDVIDPLDILVLIGEGADLSRLANWNGSERSLR